MGAVIDADSPHPSPHQHRPTGCLHVGTPRKFTVVVTSQSAQNDIKWSRYAVPEGAF